MTIAKGRTKHSYINNIKAYTPTGIEVVVPDTIADIIKHNHEQSFPVRQANTKRNLVSAKYKEHKDGKIIVKRC